MLAIAEVIKAVSLVVKWAIAPPMVQPMGIMPMTMVWRFMMLGCRTIVNGVGSDHGEDGVAPSDTGDAHDQEDQESGWQVGRVCECDAACGPHEDWRITAAIGGVSCQADDSDQGGSDS